MKLSNNFYLNEFTISAGLVIAPTDEQIFCLQQLTKNILQPIRDKFGSVKITSGLRTKQSYEKLIEQGYPASKTSDHFGWSDVNPKGTGAADFVVLGEADQLSAFHWIIKTLYDKCRQIIYYPDMNIIHVSNNFNSIFFKEDSINEDRKIMTKRSGESFKSYSLPWLCN